MTDYLTLEQTAQLLHCSLETLRGYYRGQADPLPIVKLSRRRYLVSSTALDEWLARRTVTTWSGANGDPDPSIATATNGESRSASAGIRSASGCARSGSAGRKRPPARSSAKLPVASIEAYRQTRTR